MVPLYFERTTNNFLSIFLKKINGFAQKWNTKVGIFYRITLYFYFFLKKNAPTFKIGANLLLIIQVYKPNSS